MCSQAILAGQAVAGLGVALASFITTWAAPAASEALTPLTVSRPAQVHLLLSDASVPDAFVPDAFSHRMMSMRSQHCERSITSQPHARPCEWH